MLASSPTDGVRLVGARAAVVDAPYDTMSPKKPQPVRAGPSRIGLNVRAARIRLGWSQAKLGEAIGSDKSHVGRIEIGTIQEPDRDTIERLAQAMGVDPSELDPTAAARSSPPNWLVTMRGDPSLDRRAITAIENIVELSRRGKPD